ncbi:hypothetical protein LTR95_009695 [Oleoguttula sp. CCFEE 5521]
MSRRYLRTEEDTRPATSSDPPHQQSVISTTAIMSAAPFRRCYLLELAPSSATESMVMSSLTTPPRVRLDRIRHGGPQKELLLTCQLIRDEAKLMYKAAFRGYVQGTGFTVPESPSNKGCLRFVHSEEYIEEDSAHIKKLDVHAWIDEHRLPPDVVLPRGYRGQYADEPGSRPGYQCVSIYVRKCKPRKARQGVGRSPPVDLTKADLSKPLEYCSEAGHDKKSFHWKKRALEVVDPDAGQGN